MIDQREIPQRKIYCLELGVADKVEDFVTEIRRIAKDNSQAVVGLTEWIGGKPAPEALERFHQPTNDTALGLDSSASGEGEPAETGAAQCAADRGRRHATLVSGDRLQPLHELHGVHRLLPVRRLRRRRGGDDSGRTARQLPQGLSGLQPRLPGKRHHFPTAQDSRHRGRSGATSVASRSTLSKLFGAPDAIQTAAAERDEQLVLAGREAVGTQRWGTASDKRTRRCSP